jgi:beta-fructofuranosidase
MYYMTVGAGIEKEGGCVLLYRSRNLRDWTYMHMLAQGRWSGKATSNPVGDGEMWECPDFFALNDGHVLIYSTEGKVYWQSGTLTREMKFEAKKSGLLDLDAFYAPKTQLDAQGRRVLWGWIPERRPKEDLVAAGWAGLMSLPRLLQLDADGTLRMQVLPQAEALRSQAIAVKDAAAVLPRATGEVLLAGKPGKEFSVTVVAGQEPLMTIGYAPHDHAFSTDGHSVALEPSDTPSVHAWVDGSVIEVILGERIGYTKRFYYRGAQAPDVRVSVTGPTENFQAWRISPISGDRLTTM